MSKHYTVTLRNATLGLALQCYHPKEKILSSNLGNVAWLYICDHL